MLLKMLCLLTECLTHRLVVFFIDIDRPGPQLPHEDSSRCPTVSTDYFDMRSLLSGESVYCHLGVSCVVSFVMYSVVVIYVT